MRVAEWKSKTGGGNSADTPVEEELYAPEKHDVITHFITYIYILRVM